MSHSLFDKSTHTIDEFFSAVLGIHEPEAARAFFDEYAGWQRVHAMADEYRTVEGAERVARSNIGFVFGEGMPVADIEMWIAACGAAHPIFGTRVPSSAREALALGALAAADPSVAERIGKGDG